MVKCVEMSDLIYLVGKYVDGGNNDCDLKGLADATGRKLKAKIMPNDRIMINHYANRMVTLVNSCKTFDDAKNNVAAIADCICNILKYATK